VSLRVPLIGFDQVITCRNDRCGRGIAEANSFAVLGDKSLRLGEFSGARKEWIRTFADNKRD
jgi:hypothetical protein